MRRGPRFPRFSGRDALGRRQKPAFWRSFFNRSGASGGSLRFSGRTPTALSSGREDVSPASRRGRITRSWCARALIVLLVLCAVVASRRGSLGSEVPWPAARALRIFDSSAPAASSLTRPSTWARARLVADPRGWGETFWALPTLAGEWAQRLSPRQAGASGAAWAIGLAWMLLLLWWLAALGLNTRRPSLGLGLLILAQGFGASYWLGSMRAPIRRLETSSTCRAFDLGAHIIGSGGLLSPAQSLAWHQARGFSGLALSDADASPNDFSALERAYPNMMLLRALDLSARDGTQRRLILPQLPPPLPLDAKARAIAKAFVMLPAPWSVREPGLNLAPSGQSLVPQAIEAWSGGVGDEALAREARARGLAVVGSAGSDGGSDCFVWTLLPSDVRTSEDVIKALKGRRVAVAYALPKDETPAGLETRRQESARLGVVLKSWRQSMSKLSRAQKINVWLQVLGLVLALLWWGARAAEVVEAPGGPQTAMKFLRRKRLLSRANGLAMMLLALVGSIWIARFAFSATWPWQRALPPAAIVPLSLLAWLALDALYLAGRRTWKRVH